MANPDTPQTEGGFNWLLLVPVIIALCMAAAVGGWMVAGKSGNRELPSALLGAPAPSMVLEDLYEGGSGLTPEVLSSPGVKLVNFWASWCAPCRAEHPLLTELASDGLTVIGINYKDQPANARGFLEELGNPYSALGVDSTGTGGHRMGGLWRAGDIRG